MSQNPDDSAEPREDDDQPPPEAGSPEPSAAEDEAPGGASPDGDAPDGDAQPKPPKLLALRVVVLGALLMCLNWWSSVHFGQKLSDLSAVNALFAATAAVLALLPEADRKRVKADQASFVGRLVRRALSVPALLTLWLAFAAVGSFVSSVRIEAAGVSAKTTVRVEDGGATLAKKTLEGAKEVVRVPVFAPYGGRRLTLEAKGFSTLQPVLEPWRPFVQGLDDWPRPPGVYLRVPLELSLFLEGGEMRFFCLDRPGSPPAAVGLDLGHAVVRLGEGALEVAAAKLETWRAEAAVRYPAPLVDRAVLRWRRAVEGPELDCLEPGAKLRAVLCGRHGVAGAEAVFEASAGSQHVTLRQIPPENLEEGSNLCG